MKFSLKNTGKVWGFSLPQIMPWILVVAACNGCYMRHKKNYAKRRNNVERPPELWWVSHCIVRTGIKKYLTRRIIYKI